ncbi:MAG TPA: AmmeMemoRadiSam system radical SAM enzyme [Patescibacteria group bacterium]|nr:AmmeMemoRadiSam system radical SAM enzyme [Patescibacteria group bacterium]
MEPREAREARYYEAVKDKKIRCRLCPHRCLVAEGARGACNLRENRGGMLVTLSYGRTVTANIDPIEKKPLYHFMPGSLILSIGPNGCTFSCDNCQNWSISQEQAPTQYIPPDELVALAGRGGSIGVAFTYTEPLLWFEYIEDVVPMLRARGLKSVLVTNGFLNEEPAREIASLVDGFNVDLKSMNDEFYRTYCGGRVAPVKRFIEIAASVSHLEVTNLLVPDLNDSTGEITDLVTWLAGISRDIPVHFSRFFPQYRMTDRPATPRGTLERAYRIAKEHLDHVYIGNIFIDGTEDTYCPECGETIVKRAGYSTTVIGRNGICPKCGTRIGGVWG